ncbi:Fus1p [Kluyveromyces lactis]|uniref:KLLA0C01540p n=2 Tax=Kluyveromyces lactis TaxID=28985 RepID=F2Z6I8_KLULA|nr:uncharacterized protein KLLA0_C01540g [Kluyveromyces lactis]AAM74941.1 Fus1 protein [Kluyveromyces lactis]CAH01115.1 KLLA0C01540p [Kluyveromyces lactis]|eukprot:XP_452264.1 uncharacterized protein KLLA0_C01540g [Kluyveromyces lactis]
MEIETETRTVIQTQMNELILHNEATVINTIYVDQYYRASNTLPYALTTVSTAFATQLNKNVKTATITNQVTTTIETSQESTSTSSTSHSSSSLGVQSSQSARMTSGISLNSLASTSDGKNTSGTILGLAIGLPIALFVVGLGIVFGFLYYRRFHSKVDPDNENMQQHEPDSVLGKLYGMQELNDLKKAELFNEKKQDEKYDSGVSSKITYKVSKPYISHPELIQTPEKLAFTDNPYRKNVNQKSDTNAYSNSTMDLGQFPRPLASPFKKWNYESPLSRWFLTKSTLIQDKIQTAKTPTIHLKQLNILARANKSKITINGEEPYTEMSPMLPSVPRSPYEAIESLPSLELKEESEIPINESKIRTEQGVIKPQIIDTNLKPTYPTLLKLDKLSKTKPLPKPPNPHFTSANDDQHVSDNVSARSDHHDLRSARKSTAQEQAKLYRVVKDYQAVLMDEIDIRGGELVRVLARHTDGWCLVERSNIQNHSSLDGPTYLNENRGIVPGLCLQESM